MLSKPIERISDQERSDRIENLFNPLVKSNVDAKWRLQNQLERTNIILGQGDQVGFINAVTALRGDLPLNVKQAVKNREDEYIKDVTKYKFMRACNINIGTIENPMVRVAGHDEWTTLLDVPDSFIEEYPDKVVPWSPTSREVKETDYVLYFEIIKEEIEKAGVSWQHVQETKDARKVPSKHPQEIVSIIVKARVVALLFLRKNYPDLKISYRDMNCGWDAAPPTPTYPREAK